MATTRLGTESPEPSATDGILLIGHGTREPDGVEQFLRLSSLVAERLSPLPVAPSFLELAKPSIAEGFQRLATNGAKHVVALPVILFSAGHAKRDIPAALHKAAAQSPHVSWNMAPHLGCHPSLVELSRLRVREAIARQDEIAAHECHRLFIGRGSSDDDALAEFRQFVALAHDGEVAKHSSCCFMAMARPTLNESLERLAAVSVKRVIVQPHLLFAGRLTAQIEQAVAECRTRYSDTDWRRSQALGVDNLLVRALLDRAGFDANLV